MSEDGPGAFGFLGAGVFELLQLLGHVAVVAFEPLDAVDGVVEPVVLEEPRRGLRDEEGVDEADDRDEGRHQGDDVPADEGTHDEDVQEPEGGGDGVDGQKRGPVLHRADLRDVDDRWERETCKITNQNLLSQPLPR